ASFLLLDHLDDLFVRESRLHLSAFRLGGLYTKMEEIQGLRSHTLKHATRLYCVLRASVLNTSQAMRNTASGSAVKSATFLNIRQRQITC
ncbi:hypothetical protein, partial [Pseudophaeobacter sp.]|uniref:hypothetical protein n=1 Tax=Pseudophaeobacter sp. TaxID=1971739 RepID=UPI0032D91332